MTTWERAGADIPALRNRPEVHSFLYSYWEAFFALSRSRSVGFAVNPVSIADIVAYMELKGIFDPEEREDFLHFMQEMDAEFLAWANKNSDKKNRSSRG